MEFTGHNHALVASSAYNLLPPHPFSLLSPLSPTTVDTQRPHQSRVRQSSHHANPAPAGVFGYSWVGALHILGGLSFRNTLLLANISSLAWLGVYFYMLESPEKKERAARNAAKAASNRMELATPSPISSPATQSSADQVVQQC